MLIKHIRDRLDITPGLSREDYITHAYAVEILEALMDVRHLIIFDDADSLEDVTENDLLIGNWDWEMYSSTGCSLFWTDNITMRLFGKKGLAQKEIDALTEGKDLLILQAQALQKAALFLLAILKEVQYGAAAGTK